MIKLNQIEKIKEDLKNNLSEYRYEHSILVAQEAKKLACHYNVDEKKAYISGLVHDIAKEFSEEENEYYIEKYNLPRFDSKFKSIIHSFVGAVYLKEKYDLDDDICEAVRVHTIGSLNMSLLDKIIFVADKIEPGKDYLGIEEERVVAKENIDKAMILCLENNYIKLKSLGKEMYPVSLEVLYHLKNIL